MRNRDLFTTLVKVGSNYNETSSVNFSSIVRLRLCSIASIYDDFNIFSENNNNKHFSEPDQRAVRVLCERDGPVQTSQEYLA